MAHKKKHGNPVPPGNQAPFGPGGTAGQSGEQGQTGGGAPDQEQDPKRRIGDYVGKGEHSYKQPGGLNDADH